MKSSLLKKVRVVLSLTFFLSIIVLFLDLSFSLPGRFADYPLYLQFIPSLLKFLSAASIASAGFIIVLILTLLFGRVYCSSVCPLGVMQDVVTFLSRKIHRLKFFKKTNRLKFNFEKPFIKTRYSILAFAVIVFLAGSIFSLSILDPYSNFGRILTNIFHPLFVGINNSIAFLLESFNLYWLNPIEFREIYLFPLFFSLVIFVLIFWMSYKYGRLYCNTICPVGTLLGLLSKSSLFKIVIDESNCKGCGVCEKVCKAGCIDTKNSFIDFERCISCYNCFAVCPTAGIEYRFRYLAKKKNTVKFDEDKRDFIKKTAIYFIGTATLLKAQNKINVYKESTVPVIRKSAVSPPGSISVDHLSDKCTACHLCVAACPTHVLQPSFLEYGFLGMLQPRMNYTSGFCNYDCKICSEVCPSDAIVPQKIDDKKLIQLGKASFIKDNCIVYSQGTDCGACAEHCPTKAVRMTLDPEVNKNAPKIAEEICIGCGACEYACPTKPYKSIYVKSNPKHLTAKKPSEEKLEEVNLEEDFPF